MEAAKTETKTIDIIHAHTYETLLAIYVIIIMLETVYNRHEN